MSRTGTRTLCKLSIFYYLFNLGWYSVQLDIFPISWLLASSGVDGIWGHILNRQNLLLLSVMKTICHCWRSLLTKSWLFCPYFFFISFLSFLFSFLHFFAFLCLGSFLFGFFICCINWNLYFLAQQRTGNLIKMMGYGLLQKKSKQVTEGWQLWLRT